MFDNMSFLEALWIIIAAVGGMYSISNIKDGIEDIGALRKVENGRRIIAVNNIRRDALRLYVQSVFFAIGVWAASIPSGNANLTIAGLIFSFAFLSCSLALTISAKLDNRERKILLNG